LSLLLLPKKKLRAPLPICAALICVRLTLPPSPPLVSSRPVCTENVFIQKISFCMLVFLSLEFLLQFYMEGLDTHSIPAFGTNYSHVMGSIVSNLCQREKEKARERERYFLLSLLFTSEISKPTEVEPHLA